MTQITKHDEAIQPSEPSVLYNIKAKPTLPLTSKTLLIPSCPKFYWPQPWKYSIAKHPPHSKYLQTFWGRYFPLPSEMPDLSSWRHAHCFIHSTKEPMSWHLFCQLRPPLSNSSTLQRQTMRSNCGCSFEWFWNYLTQQGHRMLAGLCPTSSPTDM